jgi:hypothetical protein
MGYTFYVDGRPVGRTDIRVTKSANSLRFESRMRVEIGGSTVDLSCRTEADPGTFEVRTFSFEGTKAGVPVATEVHVLGDSVYGYVGAGADRVARSRKLKYPRTILFEDWVIELQILLARTQARSGRISDTYGMVIAGSFAPTEVLAGYTGEVLVEAGSRSMAARKLAVAISGGDPFESHIDPVREIPVYIRFPGVRAEVFLDEVFGENPVSYFATKNN